ncbi:hypothetical protein ACTJKO_16625 [Curtobacterium sp. 22159]|uniref:hypothetical protein n=1 Tax=Curtobacterium sp. 22159 TaxID=3453882 RepID=UPI003F87BB44
MTTVIHRARARFARWVHRNEPQQLTDDELDALWAEAKVLAADWRSYIDERKREIEAARASGDGGAE